MKSGLLVNFVVDLIEKKKQKSTETYPKGFAMCLKE